MRGDSAESFVTHGKEERNLEYKRSMNWEDPATKSKVVKAAMAMASLRDGGAIVFGMEEQNATWNPVGMSPDDQDSFSQDGVSVEVNNYADPYVELSVQKIERDGKQFIVVHVKGFDELPVLCKNDGQGLRCGAWYVRPRRKNETTEVRSQVEMREILDIALEKRVRSLHAQIARMGAELRFSEDEHTKAFDEQLGSL